MPVFTYRQPGLRQRLPLILFLLLLALGLCPSSGLTPDGRYSLRLADLTGPESFSLSRWEVTAIADKLGELVRSNFEGDLSSAAKQRTFDDFFATADDANRLEGEIDSLAGQANPADGDKLADLERQLKELRARRQQQSGLVEETIERQVARALQEENLSLLSILHDRYLFPPVFSKLENLPHVLVVSPRDRIEMKSQVTIRRDITTAQMSALEDETDAALNVSSLVVPIGGYSTYPTMIAATAPLDFVIGAVSHEWCHIYLTFRPLGLSYGKTSAVTAMNETVCSIMGDDVAALVEQTDYGKPKTPRPWETPPAPVEPAQPAPRSEPQGFNANRELGKIYKQVDQLLKAGDVAGAEQVMEDGRRRLAENGFYLRKLNQAFFAFYGSYAEGPDSIRPDPVGEDLRELRRRSPTLRDFMVTVARMTSYDDLKRALGK